MSGNATAAIGRGQAPPLPREHAHVATSRSLLAEHPGKRAAERFFSGRGIEPDRVRALLGSEPATLAAALDHLDEAHGGAERWAGERAGLTDAELGALRAGLLERD